MEKRREIRIQIPEMANVKATGHALRAKSDDAQVAVGNVILRHPKLSFWVMLVIALAGGKLLASLGR